MSASPRIAAEVFAARLAAHPALPPTGGPRRVTHALAKDAGAALPKALRERLHPHADVTERRERVNFWETRRTGYVCTVGGHEIDAAEDLAALKAALEKRLAPRVPVDPTDERLPLR